MGRKKKETLELETESMTDDTAESDASDSEFEAEEAEALAAADEDADESEAKADEEEAAPKRRRARKPKAEVKADESADDAEKIEEPKAEETPEVEVAEVIEKSKRSARARKVPVESDINQDVAVASVTVQKSMDAMVKQWASVKEISTSVSQNFDRIYQQLNELQTNYAETTDKLFKQSPPKPTPITKLAMATSAFAIVFSLLSFTFAQSVRSSALIVEAQRKALSTQALAPKQVQPEIAYAGESHPTAPSLPVPSKPKRATIRTKK